MIANPRSDALDDAIQGPLRLPSDRRPHFGRVGQIDPHVARPTLYPGDNFRDFEFPKVEGSDHYLQWVDAVRGVGTTSAPFSYAGPLTETVLIGCLATRFLGEELNWDSANLKVTNVPASNEFVKRPYRKGWEVAGLG